MKILRTIVVLALCALPMLACGAEQSGTDPASRPSAAATMPKPADGECHISAEEVANWGDTSARILKACASAEDVPVSSAGKPCHITAEEVENGGDTSARMESACADE